MKLRRPSGAWLVSILVHVVVVGLFVQALVFDRPLFDMFGRETLAPPTTEPRVRFVVTPPGGSPSAPREEQAPPLRQPSAPPPPPAPLRAPTEIPNTIAPPDRSKPATVEPSTGPMTGGQGPLLGTQPRFGDGRLWVPPGVQVGPPKQGIDLLDSVSREGIQAFNDSARVAASGRKPGDWTFEKGGQKYGMDQRFIRLGPVSIPTAVLALLPLNLTANPTVSERERRFNAMHDEIMSNAQRSMNEADFQKAVRALRERKERERKERERTKDDESGDKNDKAAESPAASKSSPR